MIVRVLIFLSLGSLSAMAEYNSLIIQQLRTMPEGGGYATNLAAHSALDSAFKPGPPPRIFADRAMPGYCSGGTYLVFLKTLAALDDQAALSLKASTWDALRPRLRPDGSDTLPDGEGIWGRWNANGPGTARLFHELKLGRNFSDFSAARPGDFMKIFWTDAVGKRERGHSVIYLGTESGNGTEMIRYWSSNQPDGFGEKSVARSKIARAIFSRLEHPERLNSWSALPETDPYLASLLKVESSFQEAKDKSGLK